MCSAWTAGWPCSRTPGALANREVSASVCPTEIIMDDDSREEIQSHGATTIAPGVLITIAQLTALGVPGVAALANPATGMNRLIRRGAQQGVFVSVEDGCVSVELHLALKQDVNVREVCRRVQNEVARAIEEMVGMQVTAIDVHVEDVEYEEAGGE